MSDDNEKERKISLVETVGAGAVIGGVLYLFGKIGEKIIKKMRRDETERVSNND